MIPVMRYLRNAVPRLAAVVLPVLAMGPSVASQPCGNRAEHTCGDGVRARAGIGMRKIVSWLLHGGNWRRP